MTYTERVGELKALLEGMELGIVHDRVRWAAHMKAFILLFKSGDRIDGWEITREGWDIDTPDLRETWVIRRYLSFNDEVASDLEFQESLDTLFRLFRDTLELDFGSIPFGVKLGTAEPRLFGGALCHYAELELVTVTAEDLL